LTFFNVKHKLNLVTKGEALKMQKQFYRASITAVAAVFAWALVLSVVRPVPPVYAVASDTRLTDKQLKQCLKREVVINRILDRMRDRGNKQLAVITKIAEQTEAFYVDKGRPVSNYDALVAAVNDKKAAASIAVNGLSNLSTKTGEGSDFSCISNDPKGFIAAFKTKLKEQNEALKAYRTAVVKLIVAVKSAQSSPNNDGGVSNKS